MLSPAARAASSFLLSFTLLTPSFTLLAEAIPHLGTTAALEERSSDNIDSFWYQGSKLGLAWPDGDASYLNKLKGVNKMYTWTESCPDEASDLGMTCLPQLWGWKNVDAFQEAAKTANPPVFLTFNEPQEAGQANMDVDSGIQLWKQALKPLRDQGHKLCSPATSSNPDGLDWVKDFQKGCPECEFDYTCVHWYDTSLEKFQDYVNLWHTTFGKPVLVTEFALQNFNGGGWQPSASDVRSFYEQAIPWLNDQSFVIGYFPFGFMKSPTGINPNDDLLDENGNLTDLGSLVLSKAGA